MVLWKDYIEKYIPYEKLLDKNFIKGHKACAQFYVNKSRILRYPKIFYENLYNWLLTTKILSGESVYIWNNYGIYFVKIMIKY